MRFSLSNISLAPRRLCQEREKKNRKRKLRKVDPRSELFATLRRRM